ncbi:GAF 3 and PDEase I domain containing protein [Trichuris trichiura]|uniref:Phosphodiesterase n=1 Tax=Trichuris trichiura TaxID=36087 RepID=A0A077ZAA0_TRITR|nr:GAF 3 and PDEase I domain containing protein [Trichuris trichiura]
MIPNSRLVSLLNSVFADVNMENVQLCLNIWIRESLPCEESAFAIISSDSENCHVQIRGVHKLSPTIHAGRVQLWRHAFRQGDELSFQNLPPKMKRYVKNIFQLDVSDPAITSHAIYDEGGSNLVGLLFIRHQSLITKQNLDPELLTAHVQVAAALISMVITTETTTGHVDFAKTMLQLFLDAFKRADDLHDVASTLCATAKKLILCEECNLYLFDRDKNEFVLYNEKQLNQQRLPATDAVLNEVLSTLEIFNISRPNDAADEAQTDHSKKVNNRNLTTIPNLGERHAKHFNTLAFPLAKKGEIMAVVEMHNKSTTPNFTPNDVNIVRMLQPFYVTCFAHSLRLKCLKEINKRLATSTNRLAITGEEIEEQDALALCLGPIQNIERFIISFTYSVHGMPIYYTLKTAMAMFYDMGFMSALGIERKKLARFLLKVKEAYRNVPYHNWYHAFSAAHFFFVMMKQIPEIRKFYSTLECASILVACFCHDMDHRGTNNAFQLQSCTRLAQLFNNEGSILECHHFTQAMAVMHAPESNIFSQLSFSDFHTAMSIIRNVIQASDLANYFRIQPDLMKLSKKGIDLTDEEHRYMLRSLLMTVCDVSDQVKTWKTSRAAAARVFEEFFAQGDLEKAMNRKPTEMMDRDKADVIKSQLQFFDNIILPVFKMISAFFPQMESVYENGQTNRRCYEIMQQLSLFWTPYQNR